MPQKFQWTEENIELVKDQYQTEGAKKLAQILGTTPISVTMKARRLGVGSTRKLPPKYFQWTKELEETIRTRYPKEGPKNLMKELNLSIDAIRRKATQLGIKTNAGHEDWGKRRRESATHCDIRYFDQWSPNMAYILGFIFADGGINKRLTSLIILLASKDQDILEFIRRELKSTSKFYYKKAGHDNRGSFSQKATILMINSKVLVEALVKRGVKPRKTYLDEKFPKVPDSMMPHFVRGYLDGDGTTGITRLGHCFVGFVGSCKFIEGLSRRLIELIGIKDKKINIRKGKTANYSSIAWSSARDIKKLYDFMYPEGFGFCLLRKKAKLDEWLSIERKERREHRFYTEKEEQQIKELYHTIGSRELGRLQNRSPDSICNKAVSLGVTRKLNP